MASFEAVLRCVAGAALALALPSTAAAQDAGAKRAAAVGRHYPDAALAGSASRAPGGGGHVAMVSLEKKRDPAAQAHSNNGAGNSVDPGSMPFAPPAAGPKAPN